MLIERWRMPGRTLVSPLQPLPSWAPTSPPLAPIKPMRTRCSGPKIHQQRRTAADAATYDKSTKTTSVDAAHNAATAATVSKACNITESRESNNTVLAAKADTGSDMSTGRSVREHNTDWWR